MDCSYCILQGYLESPVVTLFANVDSAFQNIDRFLSEQPDRLFRFGTGELGDSLALDELTGLSECTIGFFSGKRNAILELKTKTNRIIRLIALKPKNTVVSWSLNPQSVIDREEFRSAPLLARLEAARKCQDAGYLLGFHFDPVLFYRGWEEEYKDVVRRIFQHVEGSRIAWISLGTLRFSPALKEIIQKRFPKSRIICEEMIRGLDGKMRYPRPRRIEMFNVLYDLFKANQPELFVYFCMEHPAVWDAVTGSHPESNSELDFWFARSLFERFPELKIPAPKSEAYVSFNTE
jgi:spore photoproduct lyase